MDFDEYQEEALKTAVYPGIGNNFVYPTLGLVGEAGEVAEKIKKIIRDKEGVVGEEEKLALKKELGDILWYVANLSKELGLSMNEVAVMNVEKLRSRQVRNMLHGKGDDR
jgi:NTP pyrophosphatase (non-canonical NTP hydrolase)